MMKEEGAKRNEGKTGRRIGGRESKEKKKWKTIKDRNEWRVPLKESNVLCAPRNHMVLLLTQRATLNQLKCREEVKNTPDLRVAVSDLKR